MTKYRVLNYSVQGRGQFVIGLNQKTAAAMQHIVTSVSVHRDAHQPAGTGLKKNLGISLQHAGKQKNIRPPHLLAQLRRSQMPEKRNIPAVGARSQFPAPSLGLALSCEPELHRWQPRCLLDNQLHTLPR